MPRLLGAVAESSRGLAAFDFLSWVILNYSNQCPVYKLNLQDYLGAIILKYFLSEIILGLSIC